MNNKENKEWRCNKRCKEANICQKCKPIYEGGFIKAFDLEKTGVTVYVYNEEANTEEKKMRNTKAKTRNTFVVYNTTHEPIERFKYIEELNKFTTQCNRCNSILQQLRVVLDKAQGMRQNEVIGTCEYCKWVPGPIRCKRCAYIINKFLVKRIKYYEDRFETFEYWPKNIKQLVTNILEKEAAPKNNQDPSSEELKNLLQEIRKPTARRRPEILDFPASDIEAINTSGELARNTILLEKLVSILESENPSVRKNLENILGEDFIRIMPEEVLSSIGKLTREKLIRLFGLQLTNNMIDRLFCNVGKLSQEKIGKTLGPDLANNMIDRLLMNLGKLNKDKADKMFGLELTRKLIDNFLVNIGGDNLTKSKIERVFGPDIPIKIIDQILSKFEREKLTMIGLEKALGADVAVYKLFDKVLSNVGKLTKNKLDKIIGVKITKEAINILLENIGKVNLEKCEKIFGSNLTNKVVEKTLTNFGEQLRGEKLDRIIGSNLSDAITEKIMSNLGQEKLTRAKLEKFLGPSFAKEVLNQILAKLDEEKLNGLLGLNASTGLLDKIITNFEGVTITVQALDKLLGLDLATVILNKILKNLRKQLTLRKKSKSNESNAFLPPMKSSLIGFHKQEQNKKEVKYRPRFSVLPLSPEQRLSFDVLGESQLSLVTKKKSEEKETQTEAVKLNVTKGIKTSNKKISIAALEKFSINKHVNVQKTVSEINHKQNNKAQEIGATIKKEKSLDVLKAAKNLIGESEHEQIQLKPKELAGHFGPVKSLTDTTKDDLNKKLEDTKVVLGTSQYSDRDLLPGMTTEYTDPDRHVVQLLQNKRDDIIDIRDIMPSGQEETEKQEIRKKNKPKLFEIIVEDVDKSDQELKSKLASSIARRSSGLKTLKAKNARRGSIEMRTNEMQKEESLTGKDEKREKEKLKPTKISASTKELLKLLKIRETERKQIEKARIQENNNLKKLRKPVLKYLPHLPGKRQRKVEENEESIVECISGPEEVKEMVKNVKVIPFQKGKEIKQNEVPLLFKTNAKCTPVLPKKEDEIKDEQEKMTKSKIFQFMESDSLQGVIRYHLSNPEFIEKGWTKLPTTRVTRRLNIYKMVPTNVKTDWFSKHNTPATFFYDSGEKLAEIDPDGYGRWYHRNKQLALEYYKAEEPLVGSRYVVYSSGENNENGKLRLVTVLAYFDCLGNGIIFDHYGNQRLKYNQSEGVVLDKKIGPTSKWQWHNLNEPPVLESVYMDNFLRKRSHQIEKLIKDARDAEKVGATSIMEVAANNRLKNLKVDEKAAKIAYEQMLRLELDKFTKQRTQKLLQRFKPFEIKAKFLKINENLSLKIIDQANIRLQFRDGQTVLKQNLGMNLINSEIIDTQTVNVNDVATPFDRRPAKSRSMDNLMEIIQITALKSKEYKAKCF